MSSPIKSFRETIKSGSKHAPETGRYVLYVSLGCPFAMRALMTLKLKGLEEFIDLCVLDYHYTDQGLGFSSPDKIKQCSLDPIMNAKYLRELYLKACPNYEGIFSVPMIWDKKLNTIVNNESEDIMRMFNDLNSLAENPKLDLYPESLRDQIDKLCNKAMITMMKLPMESGSAKSQEEYEEKVTAIKDAFNELNHLLSKFKFLCGSEITEADIKIFNYVIRHDLVHLLLFRVTNFKLADFPNIMRWMADVANYKDLRACIDLEHIKQKIHEPKWYYPGRELVSIAQIARHYPLID